MQDFGAILDNRVLLISLAACLLTQAMKLVIELVKNQKLNFRVLVETGGMPSSHSALVVALASEVGLNSGWKSTEFAIATVVAFIVMYDAAGVRQAAGKQARILNQITDEFFAGKHELAETRLKELLGHTPVQVIVGAAMGGTIAWVSDWWLSGQWSTALSH
jgi:uncharacterized protein